VLGVYRIGDLVANSIEHLTDRGINFEIRDESATRANSLLYFHSSSIVNNVTKKMDSNIGLTKEWETSLPFDVANRQWSFNASLSPEFMEKHINHHNNLYIFLVGILLTFGLSTYLYKIKQNFLERKKHMRKQEITENVMRRDEQRLQLALSVAELGIWQWSMTSNQFSIDKNMNRILGLKREVSILDKDQFLIWVHPDDREEYLRKIEDAVNNSQLFYCEYRVIKVDGSERWLRDQGRTIFKEAEPAYMIGAVVDITNRKLAEMELDESLKEKKTLLREIHHRVKNNLQIIASLLQLQTEDMAKRKNTIKATNAAMLESRNRVRSMALVHERLYQADNLRKIEFHSYVTSLITDLFKAYGISTEQISLDLQMASVEIGINHAIPCGLIINELVSNSFKHAFPGNKNGVVHISLDFDQKNGMFELVVTDNGIGFPNGIDWKKYDTLGLRLVSTLIKQIQGEVEFCDGPGTCFRIWFKEDK
jgi:PAS domain S-box-containing protein